MTEINSNPQSWRASAADDVHGPNGDGYYTTGIDIPIKDIFGKDDWHGHAIQFHCKDRDEAIRRRDAVMLALQTAGLINALRSEEGDCVTILCDNPDFNGQPNCAILCNGYWTQYEDKRFAGDSVIEALRVAAKAKAST